MKKSTLILSAALGTLSTSTIVVSSVIATSYKTTSLSPKGSNFKDFQPGVLNGTQTIDSADYNVYGPSSSAFPFSWIMKHSMLSKSNIVLFRELFSDDEVKPQTYFSDSKFLEFKKQFYEENNVAAEAKVIDLPSYWHNVNSRYTNFIYESTKLLNEHPDKTFNFYLNGIWSYSSPEKSNGVSSTEVAGKQMVDILAAFPNAHLYLIPDGSNGYESTIDWNKEHPEDDLLNDLAKIMKYYATNKNLQNRMTYLLNRDDLSASYDPQKNGFTDQKINFASVKNIEVTDMLWSSKISANSAWSSQAEVDAKAAAIAGSQTVPKNPIAKEAFNAISGSDYKGVLNIINSMKAANGKQSLLILGSYDGTDTKFEIPFINEVVNKYSDKYNIYYKGHPAHSVMADAVMSEINKGEQDFRKQKVIVLPTGIPSEVYTDQFVSEGLHFEKFATVTMGTTALNAIKDGIRQSDGTILGGNKYNTADDIVMSFDNRQIQYH